MGPRSTTYYCVFYPPFCENPVGVHNVTGAILLSDASFGG